MKGIILAGGSGTRLQPLTNSMSKQLLPIYDKPMIYYSLSTLMLSGIREVLVISSPDYIENYRSLLGDGSTFGLDIEYAVQKVPDGIPSAFTIGEGFINNEKVALILGDNIFYGPGLSEKLKRAASNNHYATIFGAQVSNPSSFGVLEFDNNNVVIGIEEKPAFPKSNIAATGLYFFDEDVVEISKNLRLSDRGEYEIADVIAEYIATKKLKLEFLGRGYTWMDTGSVESLHLASEFVRNIQLHQGYYIGCLEEIALAQGWICAEDLLNNSSRADTKYNEYVRALANEK